MKIIEPTKAWAFITSILVWVVIMSVAVAGGMAAVIIYGYAVGLSVSFVVGILATLLAHETYRYIIGDKS